MEGKTQETTPAMAGMSVRSARKWQRGPLPSETKTERRWRTRPDPFEGVWEEEIEPLLRGDPGGKLKATTIIECPFGKLRRRSITQAGSAPPSYAPCLLPHQKMLPKL